MCGDDDGCLAVNESCSAASSQTAPLSRSISSPVPGVVVDFLQNGTTSYRL